MNNKNINNSNNISDINGGKLEKIKDFLFFYKHSGLFLIFPTLLLSCVIGISSLSISKLMNYHKKAVSGIIETRETNYGTIKTKYSCDGGFLDYKKIETIERKDYLTDNNKAFFGQAKHYELIPGVNVPTIEEIELIITKLKNTYGNDLSKAKISIKGTSSPEGKSSDSLIGKDKDSFQKNDKLANKRAEYVANMLSSLNPEIEKEMISIISEVKILSQEEINQLFGIAMRLEIINDNQLSSVDELIKQINNGTIIFELTEEEKKLINNILSRNVIIDSSLITENKVDFQSTVDIGLDKGALLYILFIGLIAFSCYSGVASVIGHQKIDNKYKNLLYKKNKKGLSKKEQKKLKLYGNKLKWDIGSNNMIFDYQYFKINGKKFIKQEDDSWLLEGTNNIFSRNKLLKIIGKIPVKYDIEIGDNSGNTNNYSYSQICTMNMEKIKESFDSELEEIKKKQKGLIQNIIITQKKE